MLQSIVEQLLARAGAARAAARARAWDAGARPESITLNIDATLLSAHSQKEQAAGTYERRYGVHPLCRYLDKIGELAAILGPATTGTDDEQQADTRTRPPETDAR